MRCPMCECILDVVPSYRDGSNGYVLICDNCGYMKTVDELR